MYSRYEEKHQKKKIREKKDVRDSYNRCGTPRLFSVSRMKAGKGAVKMKYIIDGRTMKAADAYTIGTIGIPSLVLMERAALKVVEAAERERLNLSKSLIVCGSGNNGGDGFAVGRLLLKKGYGVTAVLVGIRTIVPKRQRHRFRFLRQSGGTVKREIPEGRYTAVFDAVFGIGLSRPVEGR